MLLKINVSKARLSAVRNNTQIIYSKTLRALLTPLIKAVLHKGILQTLKFSNRKIGRHYTRVG